MAGLFWRNTRRGAIVLAGLSLGAGCTDDPYKAPIFPFMASYKTQSDAVPRIMAHDDWWKRFNDPVLNALIDRALLDSLDLDLAQERLVEARAARDSLPQTATLSPSARVQRERRDGGAELTRAEGSLGFDWLLDIYGARRAQADAAGARVAVADAEVDAARLLLLLNIANAYVDLRFQQASLHLRRSELRSRRQTLDLVDALFEAESATRIDVIRARALVSETRAEVPGIEAAIAGLKNEIAVLSGQIPGQGGINLNDRATQPRVSLSPQVGIPADLLRNRPDIRVAERSYYAALREVKTAQASLYPQLSLGGTLSLTALSGQRNTDYVFGPSLRLPILPASAQRATVALQESRVRQAHTSWKRTVISAIGDVDTALGEYAAAQQARRAAEETVGHYTEAASLTRESVSRDGGTVRDLIDAEQNLAFANAGLASATRGLGRSYIALNISLGAGHRVTATRLATK